MLVNQKILKPNASQLLFAMLIIFALSGQPFARAEDFSVTNSQKSATAVVGSEKSFNVRFDPSLASTVNSYDPFRKLSLIIGSCRMDITAGKISGQEEVNFKITDPSVSRPSTTNNPDYFMVSTSGVTFDGTFSNCKDGVKFEPHPTETGKFLVKVELDGDLPASFGLKSNVPLYVDPSKDSNEYLVWIIIGVCAIVLLGIVIIGGVVAFYFKRQKKKDLVVKQAESALKTAVSLSKTTDKSKEQKVLGKDANSKSKKDGNPKKAIAKTSNEMQPKLSKEVIPGKLEDQAMPSKLEDQTMPAKAEDKAMPSKPENQTMPSKSEDQAIPIKPENQVMPSKAIETAPTAKNTDEDDDSSGLIVVKIPQAQLDREAKQREEEAKKQEEEAAAKTTMKRNKKVSANGTIEVSLGEDNQPPQDVTNL